MLVEDDELVRGVLQQSLTALGYRVVLAKDGEEAIALGDDPDVEFDLLLTDVIMTGMGGGELAENLRSIRPGLRVLYVSGHTADALSNRGSLPAGVLLLQKPFSREQLGMALREVFDAEPPETGDAPSREAGSNRDEQVNE